MVEIVVFNYAIGPEPLHQLIFTEETPVVFDKQAEGVEDLSTKRNRFARTQQAAFGNIQMKRFEMKDQTPPSQTADRSQAGARMSRSPVSRLYPAVTALRMSENLRREYCVSSLRLVGSGTGTRPELGSGVVPKSVSGPSRY